MPTPEFSSPSRWQGGVARSRNRWKLRQAVSLGAAKRVGKYIKNENAMHQRAADLIYSPKFLKAKKFSLDTGREHEARSRRKVSCRRRSSHGRRTV